MLRFTRSNCSTHRRCVLDHLRVVLIEAGESCVVLVGGHLEDGYVGELHAVELAIFEADARKVDVRQEALLVVRLDADQTDTLDTLVTVGQSALPFLFLGVLAVRKTGGDRPAGRVQYTADQMGGCPNGPNEADHRRRSMNVV